MAPATPRRAPATPRFTPLVPSVTSIDHHVTSVDTAMFMEGQRVAHDKFGAGTIITLEGDNFADRKAVIHFDQCGTKTLLLKFAKMKILSQ